MYSDAIILRFWKNESGRLNYTAEASPAFPTNLIPLAHRLGEMTVRMSDKMAKPQADGTVTPEISSIKVAPHRLPRN